MKSKKYINRALQDFDSMVRGFQDIGNHPDKILIDKALVEELTQQVFKPDYNVQSFYRGVPVEVIDDDAWTSLYNFVAFKDRKPMFKHYTLVG